MIKVLLDIYWIKNKTKQANKQKTMSMGRHGEQAQFAWGAQILKPAPAAWPAL